MRKTSFSIEEETLENINSRLSYGDNRSAWIRDAIKMKLELIDEVEELENMTDEERREFVVETVREEIDEQ